MFLALMTMSYLPAITQEFDHCSSRNGHIRRVDDIDAYVIETRRRDKSPI